MNIDLRDDKSITEEEIKIGDSLLIYSMYRLYDNKRVKAINLSNGTIAIQMNNSFKGFFKYATKYFTKYYYGGNEYWLCVDQETYTKKTNEK